MTPTQLNLYLEVADIVDAYELDKEEQYQVYSAYLTLSIRNLASGQRQAIRAIRALYLSEYNITEESFREVIGELLNETRNPFCDSTEMHIIGH